MQNWLKRNTELTEEKYRIDKRNTEFNEEKYRI